MPRIALQLRHEKITRPLWRDFATKYGLWPDIPMLVVNFNGLKAQVRGTETTEKDHPNCVGCPTFTTLHGLI
jgi:hypothetical protein